MLLTGRTFVEVTSRLLLRTALRLLVAKAGQEARLPWLLVLHAHPQLVLHLLPEAEHENTEKDGDGKTT